MESVRHSNARKLGHAGGAYRGKPFKSSHFYAFDPKKGNYRFTKHGEMVAKGVDYDYVIVPKQNVSSGWTKISDRTFKKNGTESTHIEVSKPFPNKWLAQQFYMEPGKGRQIEWQKTFRSEAPAMRYAKKKMRQ